MSSKHTPGPWAYQEDSDAYTHIVRGSSNRFICQLAQTTSAEIEANARLIASAPESHEANQLFVQAINEMQGISPDHSDERIYDEMPSSQLAIAYFAARAAIAKATGGAQ
ncbi:hypothetical protein DFO63_4079 [Stenotrophomonas sp. AG209]|uniref:hypothetical protein n=1 Tax=Stenotrophomonas sp. AG209 TaxID=2183909 RepID=UPI000E5BD15E|nr:hypothetical protein [Stenotrophomonas sp. AG209]RIA19703.1 hypothetical protein DFO63_4079 [Stenotrophomonas sp. AG209]